MAEINLLYGKQRYSCPQCNEKFRYKITRDKHVYEMHEKIINFKNKNQT